MGPLPDSGDQKNFDEGTVVSYEQLTTGIARIKVNTRLTDESNRYDGGLLFVEGYSEPFEIITSDESYSSNTDNAVFDDDVVILGVPGSGIVGKAFKIYDDDKVKVNEINPLRMPYKLSGGLLIYSSFAEGYIEPFPVPSEYIQRNIPFSRNTYPGFGYEKEWWARAKSWKQTPEGPDIWSVHAIAAWQSAVSGQDSDNDPTAGPTESVGMGISIKDNCSMIFVEVCREQETIVGERGARLQSVLVHEIGHQGDGEHADNEMNGLMMESAPIFNKDKNTVRNVRFAAETLKKFREGQEF